MSIIRRIKTLWKISALDLDYLTWSIKEHVVIDNKKAEIIKLNDDPIEEFIKNHE